MVAEAMPLTLYSLSAMILFPSEMKRDLYTNGGALISFLALSKVAFPPNSIGPQGAVTSVVTDDADHTPAKNLFNEESSHHDKKHKVK
jgi:hypothetical protein